MPFWRCYYHVIWTTKHRSPLITPAIERVVFGSIGDKCNELKCEVYALNGISDHIHVAVSIPPHVSVANWIKHVKGTSSFVVNEHFPDENDHFRWQSGYSVLTFGVKHLPFVVRYIDQQKIHHAHNNLEPYLERVDGD